jgi:hypothetical protein
LSKLSPKRATTLNYRATLNQWLYSWAEADCSHTAGNGGFRASWKEGKGTGRADWLKLLNRLTRRRVRENPNSLAVVKYADIKLNGDALTRTKFEKTDVITIMRELIWYSPMLLLGRLSTLTGDAVFVLLAHGHREQKVLKALFLGSFDSDALASFPAEDERTAPTRSRWNFENHYRRLDPTSPGWSSSPHRPRI